MDKFDFINQIIALYPHAITDKKAQYDTYSRALSKNKIDFEKLMDLYAEEYKDSFPPAPGVLKEMAARCLKEEIIKAEKWIQVRIYNPIYKCEQATDCFPAGTSEDAILNTYKKMFGGEGWKIIKVY